MNEDYVSYKLALKLKACGFDEPCDHYYTPNKTLHIVKSNALAPEITNNRFLDEIDDGCCTAVPLWHAQKWLREKHHISVRVSYIAYHKAWFADWLNLDSGEFDDMDATFATYEEALSEGIETALELINHK